MFHLWKEKKCSQFSPGGDAAETSHVTFVFMSHMTFWAICCWTWRLPCQGRKTTTGDEKPNRQTGTGGAEDRSVLLIPFKAWLGCIDNIMTGKVRKSFDWCVCAISMIRFLDSIHTVSFFFSYPHSGRTELLWSVYWTKPVFWWRSRLICLCRMHDNKICSICLNSRLS